MRDLPRDCSAAPVLVLLDCATAVLRRASTIMAEDKQKNVSVMVQMQRVKLYTGCCSLKLAWFDTRTRNFFSTTLRTTYSFARSSTYDKGTTGYLVSDTWYVDVPYTRSTYVVPCKQ